MFGFSLATQLFQGSAQRTWNCVTQFTNLIWYKFNHIRHPIMPRSRRRHHSRSRSRSRSHSHDRDREAKRRKIDGVESPTHKRSVSCEPRSPATEDTTDVQQIIQIIEEEGPIQSEKKTANEDEQKASASRQLEDKLSITPKKAMSPKQLQNKLQSEKKRQQKQQERERLRLEKQKQKEEKEKQREEQKQKKEKERELKEEQKRKEREEKEAKRKEKEEREEQKRKEREQEKLRKQQELDEKNKEKQKLEEQKQKAAAAFVNFFVAKKPEAKADEGKTSKFMPFEVKSDMKLTPQRRPVLTLEEKRTLEEYLEKPNGNASYLTDLKNGRTVGKCEKTWPYEEDVIIVEEDFGVSICEDDDKLKAQKMRVKFLKFHENRRPAYFGTWRKKSGTISPRKPFSEDKSFFDYEVDSDDDWEEEEQGESLSSDDEEKENEAENDDYEVDNEFFVPHGHLSDDEVDDEAVSKLSPESQKHKLKLLKDEFDQDMQMKTHKMKPRSIGCVWYNKDGSNVDESIDRHLRPLAMLTNGQVIIKKRKDLINQTPIRRYAKELREELVPAFLKMIHGNVNKRTMVVDDFINYMHNNGYTVEVSKTYLGRRLKQFAQWKKCTEKGPLLNKFCWCVEESVKKKYNIDLCLT